jgi:ankyrin repeat protein
MFWCDAFQAQNRYSALMLAAKNGHSDSVRLLVESGADTDARCSVRATIVSLVIIKARNREFRLFHINIHYLIIRSFFSIFD